MRGVEVWRWLAAEERRAVLLADVEWTVAEGEQWAVLGPNGAGKTTLLNLAAAVSHPSSGEVEVLGKRLGAVDMRALRERVGTVEARLGRRIQGRSTGLEVVLTGAYGSIALQHNRIDDADRERALRLLEEIGAAPLRERLIAALDRMAANDPRLPTVTVTHHLEEIPASTTHVLLLAGGRVFAQGAIASTLTAANVSGCFGIEVEVARNGERWAAATARP
jgi:iron complex transport system ATP-binding protein